MRKAGKDKANTGLIYAGLMLCLALLFLLSVLSGSVSTAPEEWLSALFRGPSEEMTGIVLWSLRLPRFAAAIVMGSGLAVSGYLLQTYFENPIAGPYVLGISGGAKMSLVLLLCFLLPTGIRITAAMMISACFAGALLSTGIILCVASRVRHAASILIGGVMIGYAANAVTDFLITCCEEAEAAGIHGWSLGSFSGIGWEETGTAASVIVPLLLLTCCLSREIGALRIGEGYASTMGVPVKLFRILLILTACLLSAVVTAFSGPISFVGVAVPFIMKKLLRTTAPEILLPAIILGGAIFTAGADLLARTMLSPSELNISTVTSLFGAPLVIIMLMERGRHGE